MSLTVTASGTNIIGTFSLGKDGTTYDYLSIALASSSPTDYITYSYCPGSSSGTVTIACSGYDSYVDNKKLVLRYIDGNGSKLLESEPFTWKIGNPIGKFVEPKSTGKSFVKPSASGANILVNYEICNDVSTSDFVAICDASDSSPGSYLTYSYATGNKIDKVEIACSGYESWFDNAKQGLVIRYYAASNQSLVESEKFKYSSSNPVQFLNKPAAPQQPKSVSPPNVASVQPARGGGQVAQRGAAQGVQRGQSGVARGGNVARGQGNVARGAARGGVLAQGGRGAAPQARGGNVARGGARGGVRGGVTCGTAVPQGGRGGGAGPVRSASGAQVTKATLSNPNPVAPKAAVTTTQAKVAQKAPEATPIFPKPDDMENWVYVQLKVCIYLIVFLSFILISLKLDIYKMV